MAVVKKRSNTPEYLAWRCMVRRCYDPLDRDYANYGGRGITVFEGWLGSFHTWLTDVGNKPEPKKKYSLGRIENNGNYEPGNVEWQTKVEQANNTRRNRFFKIGDVVLTLEQTSRLTGISKHAIRQRLKQGESIEAAIGRPMVGRRRRTGIQTTPKLRADQVHDIRELFRKQGNKRAIAKQYGVAPNTIADIVNGKTWKPAEQNAGGGSH